MGNSLAVPLPKHIVQALNLKESDRLTITEEAGKIILEPIPELPELTLDDLLSQVTEESEVDWGKAEGEKVW